MSVFKCKMCGGALEVAANDTVATCEYCGTQQTLPKVNDEVIANLHNRANTLRLKCEFDKAEEIYNKILENDNNDVEAHWGIILCKYGIEYVEDPKTYKRVPTCHRTSFDAVLADEDYKIVIKNCDAVQRAIYEAEAKEIDSIQKDILSIVKNEKPFDVFICYKETDINGKRTTDSVIANDIYHQLTQEGFKVFYSAITLEDKIGREYEPYIFAALNSAKVMLVVGSKPEYFNAVWVKNEWSRFLKLMKTDRKKLLIPCYKDIDAYELPEEFAHLQAQDMSKIGFINDVVRGIKKVIATDEPKTVANNIAVNNAPTNSSTAPLLERAFMFLEDGEFTKAEDFAEQVLNLNPKCAEAYLVKLMAETETKTREAFKNRYASLTNDNANYQKLVRFGDEALIKEIETARKDGIYQDAVALMNTNDPDNIKRAVQLFSDISEHKNSKEMIEKCKELNNEYHYKEAKIQMSQKTKDCYLKAIHVFKTINDWKDAEELIRECENKISEIEAEEKRIEEEKRIAKKKAEKKRKIIKVTGISIIVMLITLAILLITVIIPAINYNRAVDLMEEKKYSEAKVAFEIVDGYKDSKAKIDECMLLSLKNPTVGNTVWFGSYEQDNNTSNGKEAIEWIVLEKEESKVLVTSKYAIDCKKYNTKYTDVTWETCTLRKWLNNDFINTAFSEEEKSKIPTVTVSADKNPKYDTNPGNETQDKVFLLSITEAEKYFTTDEARKCAPTKYAKAQGAYTSSSETLGGKATCWWWLRSPGGLQKHAVAVHYDGSVYYGGCSVISDNDCVRPAMWINLDS